MAQMTSEATQLIKELLRKMQEKEEERKKKRWKMQIGGDAEHPSEKEDQILDRDNMTTEASSSQPTTEIKTGSNG